jgi:hypothetical protein
VELGLAPEMFWRSTPRMVGIIATAAQRRREAGHNQFVWLAFNTAAFHRARRLSQHDMRRLLLRRDRKPQTPDQMREIARMITLAHGGSVH